MSKVTTLLLATSGVLVIAILTLVLIVMTKKPETPSTPGITPEINQKPVKPGFTLEPVYTIDGNNQQVDIYLVPQTSNQPLNSLALKVDLSPTNTNARIIPAASKPIINREVFPIGSWSTPFSDTVLNDDQTVSLKMSLVSTASQPFTLNEKVLLVSIPITVTQTSDIILSTDHTVSQMFDAENQEYSFLPRSPITITTTPKENL